MCRRNFFLALRVAQVKEAKVFFPTSYIKDTYVEAVEFRQGWSVAKNKGDEKKTKEGGLSPQEGDFRKKKTRRPRKVVCLHEKGTSEEDTRRREGGSAKERFRVSSTKKFLFLVNEYLGSERPVLFE